MPTVLIFASTEDAHAQVVAWELKNNLNIKALIIDSGTFPESFNLTVGFDSLAESEPFLLHMDGITLRDSDILGVWRRRVNLPQLTSIVDSDHRKFCMAEARSLLYGWFHLISDKALNPLVAEFRANEKAYQLAIARMVGLRIPKTVITNSDTQAKNFLHQVSNKAIYKVLTSGGSKFVETRRVGVNEISNLHLLNNSPAIFQEEIAPGDELRAVIVDDQIFSVRLIPNEGFSEIDWRLDGVPRSEKFELDEETKLNLIALHRALGLRFGVADLRKTHDGEVVFFETNPSGQFLFMEIDTDLGICRAIAESLAKPALISNQR